jgi:hypothetical protein
VWRCWKTVGNSTGSKPWQRRSRSSIVRKERARKSGSITEKNRNPKSKNKFLLSAFPVPSANLWDRPSFEPLRPSFKVRSSKFSVRCSIQSRSPVVPWSVVFNSVLRPLSSLPCEVFAYFTGPVVLSSRGLRSHVQSSTFRVRCSLFSVVPWLPWPLLRRSKFEVF